MKRKLKLGRILALVITIIILIGIGFFALDKYRFNAYIDEANKNFMLTVNGVEYEPSIVTGEEFYFNEQERKPIKLQVPRESELNIGESYVLTDENGQAYEGEVSYLKDGNYTLVIENGKYTYEYDLEVDNDFYVEIDQTKSFRAGWLVVNFYDLNEGEEVTINPSFLSSEYFIFKETGTLIPISYDSVEGDVEIEFSTSLSTLTTPVFINSYQFREDHFNIDTTVASNAMEEPDPVVLENYRTANNSQTFEGSYQSGFVTPAEGYTTGDYGDIRYINGDVTPTKIHYGIDYANARMTPIYSTSSGTVTFADFLPSTGNAVVVDHGNGITSHYFHMHEISVSVGDVVNTDTMLGGVGTTGFSTGDHLHFEIHINGVGINPHLMLDQPINFN